MDDKYSFMKPKYNKSEIDYIECRFVIHIPKTDNTDDLHLIKEAIHLKNGDIVPHVRYIKDFKRKYWITKPKYRTYKQKKEYESLDNLIERESIESDLYLNVAKDLDQYRLANRHQQLKQSPYLYGLDIPSTIQIKELYKRKLKNRPITPFSICYSDTETDVLGKYGNSKPIIMQSIYFNGLLYTVILKDFVSIIPEVNKTLKEMYDDYLPQEGKDIVTKWIIDYADSPLQIVKMILEKCHEIKPDFISFWNMLFDLEKMLSVFDEANLDAGDYFCDPQLPRPFRFINLKKDKPAKVTASGRQITKIPADQWHTLTCPSSFYFIDQMATYRFIRKSKQLDKSYSLDNILKKELNGLGKLKYEPAENLNGMEFHIHMQRKYPGQYIIYHIWDVLCMKVMNDKTKDMDYTLPAVVDISDFSFFNSEPKRYIHKFHYFIYHKHNSVTGTVADNIKQEYDQLTIDSKGHIVTLEPHLTIDNGLHIFEDFKGLQSNFYVHAADLDIVSSYPTTQYTFNISRNTTKKEIIEIDGISEEVKRTQGLNLSGGKTNAIEFTCNIFGLPTLTELCNIYDKK